MNDHAKTSKPASAETAEERTAGLSTGATSRAPAPGTAGPAAGIDPISVGLQRLFESVADEPVPDDFMALLDRIEAAERERDSNEPPSAGGRARQ